MEKSRGCDRGVESAGCNGLLCDAEATPARRFTVSDMPLRFRSVGQRFLGNLIGAVEEVVVEGRLGEVSAA